MGGHGIYHYALSVLNFFFATVLVCDGFGDDILIVVVISVAIIGIINIFLVRGCLVWLAVIYPVSICFVSCSSGAWISSHGWVCLVFSGWEGGRKTYPFCFAFGDRGWVSCSFS